MFGGEMMSLGLTLQRLRKSKNLSQEAFADIMKVSRQSVSKWELDQTYPEINKLIEIADYYEVTLDELIRDKHDEMANNIRSKEVEEIKSNDIPKERDKTLLQQVRSLPMKVKLTLFIAVTILFLFVSYMVGDYFAFIAYLSSALTASIIRRLKGENVR
jgi:transcriptional regulator with XRE-family HTH domain